MYSTIGHYWLPLTKREVDVENASIVFHTEHINDLSKTEEEKKVKKLHR